jgi:hypothetical protein
MVAFVAREGAEFSPASTGRGMFSQYDVETLGIFLRKLWPLDTTPCFEKLVHAIDREDRKAHARQALRKRATNRL